MSKNITSLRILLVSALLLMPVSSMSSELDVDKLLGELEGQLQVSKDRLTTLEPELRATLEEKSDELSSSLDSALDQGLAELGKMEKKYAAASAEASEKLRDMLESDEVTELKSFLSGLDENAIREARDQLVAEFMEVLQLTAAQIEAIKPLLLEKLEQLSAILKKHLNQGKDDFEQFRVEFEAESQKGIEQFEAILDSEQVEKFETTLESIKQSINTEVFGA